MSKWRSVTTGVPWKSLLEVFLFNIFSNPIGRGTECTLSKFTRDTKLGGAADNLDWRQDTQRDFHRLEEEDSINFKKLSKAKCQVLHLDWGNIQYQYRRSVEYAESRLGVSIDEKLNMSQQYMLASQTDNHILSCKKENIGSRSSKMIFLFYYSHDTPTLRVFELCSALGSPAQKDMDLLELVKRRVMKMIRGLPMILLMRKGWKICACSKKRSTREALLWPINIYKGVFWERERLYTGPCSERKRCPVFKLSVELDWT